MNDIVKQRIEERRASNIKLSKKETAAFLRISVSTLDEWNRKGIGPKRRRHNKLHNKGKCFYFLKEIEDYELES